ncbi:hypothetical protein AaE_010331, partial [Aphanomyces astaci]
MVDNADGTSTSAATIDADVHVRMELTAWTCEIRQLLSRLVCLGTAASVPPEEARHPSNRSRHISETGGSTGPSMYTLTRVAKCPLLWTLQGMSGDVVLRYYGHHDVILFPQVVAKLTDTQRLVHSLDSLVLVKLDAVPSALTTRPAATMKEMGDMLVRVTALKKRRDMIKQNLQAVGPAAYAAFQVDVSAHTATERRRCQARLRTRQTQFQTWFAHMTIEAPIKSDPTTTDTTTSTTTDMEQIDPSSTDTPPIDLASTPPPPDDVEMI